ncbi:MAG: ABC transporter substrate-binding protein [Chloroflexi bacterium]|nr:ABC transporter substrate-binding protein [Chloroflexota bacterium]
MKLRSRHLAPFLVLGVLLLLLACARAAPTPTPTKAPPTATPTTAPVVAPAATPTPTRAVTVAPTATPTRVLPTATPTTRPGPKGVLNVIDGLGTELWLLRPSTGEAPLWLIGEPLVTFDYDIDAPTKNGILQGWEIKVNPDGSRDWTLNIRKGVKFHKGWGEMTADDIKFSLIEFRKPASVNANTNQLITWYGNDPNNMTVKDPYTLVIHETTIQPITEVFRIISEEESRTFRPYSKKYMEQVGEDKFQREPVYAGPYEWAAQQRGYSVKLKAVPDHFRLTPGFAEINYYKVLEDATRLAMLRTGQIDMAAIPGSFAGELKNTDVKIVVSPNSNEPFITFGGLFPDRPGCDPNVPWVGGCKGSDMLSERPLKVRRAFTMATDRPAIVEKIQFGYGSVGALSFSFISDKFPWWKSDWKPLPYDPKQAKQLMTEVGYPNCFEFNFWIQPENPTVRDIGEAVASMLESNLGCKIKRRVGEYRPVLRNMLVERNTAGWMYNFAGGPIARPYRYACLHGGPTYEVITHTELPFFTELCVKARDQADLAAFMKIEQEIGDNINKYFPTIPISLNHQLFGVSPKVKEGSWVPKPRGGGLHRLEYAQPK